MYSKHICNNSFIQLNCKWISIIYRTFKIHHTFKFLYFIIAYKTNQLVRLYIITEPAIYIFPPPHLYLYYSLLPFFSLPYPILFLQISSCSFRNPLMTYNNIFDCLSPITLNHRKYLLLIFISYTWVYKHICAYVFTNFYPERTEILFNVAMFPSQQWALYFVKNIIDAQYIYVLADWLILNILPKV